MSPGLQRRYPQCCLCLLSLLLASTMADQFNYTIPQGEAYKTGANVSESVDWYKHVKWFISLLVPDDPPIDQIVELAQGNAAQKRIQDLGVQILQQEAGFIAFIVIGLLMFVIMLFAAIISCCCFCCGSKVAPTKNSKSDKNRKTMYLVLSGLLLLLLVGVLFMFGSSRGLHSAMKKTKNRLYNNLDDANIFLNNTRQQIRYITDDAFGDTILGVQDTLSGVSEEVFSSLKTKMKTKDLFDDLDRASKEYSTTTDNFKDIVHYVEDFLKLCGKITNLEVNRAALCSKLPPTSNPACDNFRTAIKGLGKPCDNEQLIKDQKTMIKNQYDQMMGVNLTSVYTDAKKNFNEISDLVADKVADVIKDVNKVLEDVKNGVKDADSHLDDLTDKVRNITTKGKDAVHSTMEDPTAQDVNEYVHAALNALSGLILIIWLLLALGVFLGALCYDRNSNPDERSCKSRCVGVILLLPVVLILLFSSLFWLFSTLLFTIGGHAQAYVCQPLFDEPDFKMLDSIVLQVGRYSNIDGSYLGYLILKNNSIDLTASSILKTWKDDVPVYRALQLNNLFDVEDKLDYEKNTNFDEVLDKLTTVEVGAKPFPSSFSIELGRAYTTLDTPGLDELSNLLNIDKGNVTAITNGFAALHECSPVVEPECTPVSQSVKEVTDSATALVDKNIKGIVHGIQDTQTYLKELITKLKLSLEEKDQKLNETLKGVIDRVTEIYPPKIVKHVDTFVNFVNESLNERIAGCRPLWNVFDTARTILCKDILDPMNGFWFGLGWCLVFLIPTMILAVYLSKHFRRLKHFKKCSSESLLGATAPPYYTD